MMEYLKLFVPLIAVGGAIAGSYLTSYVHLAVLLMVLAPVLLVLVYESVSLVERSAP